MSDSPWFSLYASDFLAGTACMEPDEVGVYVRLLCIQWDKGQIPTDERALARACGCFPDELHRYRKLIDEKFPGGRNNRLVREFEKREQQRQAGQKGGEAKARRQRKSSERPSERRSERSSETSSEQPSETRSKTLAPQPQLQPESKRESTHAREPAPSPELAPLAHDLETLKSRLGTVRRGWGVEFGADERESLIRQGYLAELLALTEDDWQDMAEMLGSSQKAADRREALKIGMPNRRTLITNLSDWLSNLERYSARHRRKANGHAKPAVEVVPLASDEEREQMRRMIAESLK